jgi:hypothetical protein
MAPKFGTEIKTKCSSYNNYTAGNQTFVLLNLLLFITEVLRTESIKRMVIIHTLE